MRAPQPAPKERAPPPPSPRQASVANGAPEGGRDSRSSLLKPCARSAAQHGNTRGAIGRTARFQSQFLGTRVLLIADRPVGSMAHYFKPRAIEAPFRDQVIHHGLRTRARQAHIGIARAGG